MKFEITMELLEEIVTCVSDCELSADEAIKYAKECVLEDIKLKNKDSNDE